MTDLPKDLAIIGLGYVGLPLAAEFGRFFGTVGFDIDPRRIANCGRSRQDNGIVAG
jgi:UDP-N-acetyl-D-mannosaminuronate dehydrogenase